MLEVLAHTQLKQLLKREPLTWPHNLTFSRLVARSIRRNDMAIIQYEIANPDDFWPGLLIPICFNPSSLVLILSEKSRLHLLNVEIPRLQKIGFDLACWQEDEPPPGNQLWTLNTSKFLNVFEKGYLKGKYLIFLESNLIVDRLIESISLEFKPQDWNRIIRAFPDEEYQIMKSYERLNRRIITGSNDLEKKLYRLELHELVKLKKFLKPLQSSDFRWKYFLNSDIDNWVSWADVETKTLSWKIHLQPIDPFITLHQVFQEKPSLFLLESSHDSFLQTQLQKISCSLNLDVKIGGPIFQEPISVFMPSRQPLPNTEVYSQHLLDQARRLILGQTGLTIVLLNDEQLRMQLAAELAAEFGKRVIHEMTAPDTNGVICCRWQWWLDNASCLPAPDQLIVALLPFPTLSSPSMYGRVQACKRKGKDWFRELLLPKALTVFSQALKPIRRNNGRLAILDGRLRSRSWGRYFLNILEPWTPLQRLLPK